MKTPIVAVLLAGGQSERFWPFSGKGTFHYVGKPLLTWQYEALYQAGITRCLVVTNSQTNNQIASVPAPSGLSVSYIKQKGFGMGNAVASIGTVLTDEPVLFLNASDYYAKNFLAMFISRLSEQKGMVVGAVKVSEYFPGGYIEHDEKNRVTKIIEKPRPGNEPSSMVTIVADYVSHAGDIIEEMKKSGSDPIRGYENAINARIANGTLCSFRQVSPEQWKPVKYPWHALDVTDALLQTLQGQHIHSNVVVKKNVVIEGPVMIEKGVQIFEGTKIIGPVYIGQHTIVGNNNMIRHTTIGKNCVTGFNTDMTRSIIGDNCWFHSNYVGDSVIADNVSMGSGTVCANLRLDDGVITSMVKDEKITTGRNKLGVMIGKEVRIGINTSIMPGIKIGSNSFIAAGIVIHRDIPDSSFVSGNRQDFSIAANKKVASVSREEFRKRI